MVQTATQSNKIKFPQIKNQFTAEIEFGMPSKACKNFGICRINPLRKNQLALAKGNVAIVTLFETGDVELAFLRNLLRPNSYQKFLATEFFLVEEDYCFPAEEKEGFHFKIKKGEYPIQERASMIMVNFK